jgi:hypothetical protein
MIEKLRNFHTWMHNPSKRDIPFFKLSQRIPYNMLGKGARKRALP